MQCPNAILRAVEQVVRRAFAAELEQGQVQSVEVQHGCSIIAVVGDGMAGMPGLAAKFFSTLGRAGINVRAIAQGSSERNISAVVDADDATRALRAAHSGFYLSAETLSVGLIGPGNVGAVLLEQMAAQAKALRANFGLDFRVRGIATSSQMLLAERCRGPRELAGGIQGWCRSPGLGALYGPRECRTPAARGDGGLQCER